MKKILTETGRKILGYMLVLSLMSGFLLVPDFEARADTLVIGLSSSSVKIGDKVTVTVTVPAGVTATINLTYPTDMFKYYSASDVANANGGTVSMTLGSYGASDAKTSGTVTFTATSAGSGRFSVTAPNAGNQEGDRVTVGGASASVTVKNESSDTGNNADDTGDGDQSADNSLASLSLSSGTLSPAFQYNVTSYTAEVANNVTSVAVSAKPSNAGATVESVTGGENLSVGKNTIQVVVKAENGVTATYTITVTRRAEGEDVADPGQEGEDTPDIESDLQEGVYYEIDGARLYPSGVIPETLIPEGFVQSTITISGQTFPCLYSEKVGSLLCLLYLVDENGENGAWYMVAESNPDYVYPFVCINYEQYRYLIGETEDIQEETDMNNDTKNKEIKKLEGQRRVILRGFIILSVSLLLIICALTVALIFKRRGEQDDMDDLDDMEESGDNHDDSISVSDTKKVEEKPQKKEPEVKKPEVKEPEVKEPEVITPEEIADDHNDCVVDDKTETAWEEPDKVGPDDEKPQKPTADSEDDDIEFIEL